MAGFVRIRFHRRLDAVPDHVRFADRGGVGVVDSRSALIGVLRVKMVAAGKGGARGNEEGGSGKCEVFYVDGS